MKTNETATPVRAFNRAYINGQFVTPHGTQVVDLVNPTDNQVIGKVTMADEIDTRKAIGAAKEAFNTFSQSSKEYRMDCLQRLHEAVARRMDQLVEATVVEYGAPQDRAKGSNNLAANIFLHFKKVLEDFDLEKTVGTSKVVMEPAGVVGIFTPWNSSAGSIAIKVAPAIAAGCTVVITRLARFKQLCAPEELKIKVTKDECMIEPVWLHAQEETPPLLTDAAFVSFVELGRRGTGHLVKAKRVELKRSAETTGFHEVYFKGPIKFGARRNALVLHATDLDRPFLTYNAELLDMLNPQLERALEERRAQSSISVQVKWILKRLLAGSRPEISAVARELGLSERTLQRRIIDDGATFRQLLLEARQELAHEYLNRPEMDVKEVAFLLGYEDSNSFYRAFRTWEGTTPSQLRAALRRPESKQ
jgi:AraC-like DNA-binding protein